jgi:hypothetical protein
MLITVDCQTACGTKGLVNLPENIRDIWANQYDHRQSSDRYERNYHGILDHALSAVHGRRCRQ